MSYSRAKENVTGASYHGTGGGGKVLDKWP